MNGLIGLPLRGTLDFEVAMFEKFTDRSRAVMSLSRQEAQRFGAEYIGTEHILMGLLLGGGIHRTLADLDLDPIRVRNELERRVGRPGPRATPLGHVPLSTRSKRALQLAAEIASERGHDGIGTDDLLLGLLREGEGIAARVLRSGVGDVHLDVKKMLESLRPDPDPILSVEHNPPGSCGICLHGLSGTDLIACSKCGASYHPECWEFNYRRCAAFGCFKAAPAYVPFAAPRRAREVETLSPPVQGGGWTALQPAGSGVDLETFMITFGVLILTGVLWLASALR